jgi:hypothetical protein
VILDEFRLLPPCGRHLVRINEQTIAARVGCSRDTVRRAINDLEAECKVLRFGRRDNRGLILRMLCEEANPTLRGIPLVLNAVGNAQKRSVGGHPGAAPADRLAPERFAAPSSTDLVPANWCGGADGGEASEWNHDELGGAQL